jgi:hypothetical protein
VNIADAILAMKIIARTSMPTSVNIRWEADVNGDKKIGIQEVIYILQTATGLR